jgi:hypothetical protein
LLDELDENTRTRLIFNTVLPDEILNYLRQFDLPVHNGKRLYAAAAQRIPVGGLQHGRNVALLIDEA